MSSTFSNLTKEMNFQFKKQENVTDLDLMSMKGAALTQFCVLPKIFHSKIIETDLIFFFKLALTGREKYLDIITYLFTCVQFKLFFKFKDS